MCVLDGISDGDGPGVHVKAHGRGQQLGDVQPHHTVVGGKLGFRACLLHSLGHCLQAKNNEFLRTVWQGRMLWTVNVKVSFGMDTTGDRTVLNSSLHTNEGTAA